VSPCLYITVKFHEHFEITISFYKTSFSSFCRIEYSLRVFIAITYSYISLFWINISNHLFRGHPWSLFPVDFHSNILLFISYLFLRISWPLIKFLTSANPKSCSLFHSCVVCGRKFHNKFNEIVTQFNKTLFKLILSH